MFFCVLAAPGLKPGQQSRREQFELILIRPLLEKTRKKTKPGRWIDTTYFA
jgi:hypothetical protein